MESTHLNLVDGTSARVHTLQQTVEYEKDRWDVRNIPGCSYPPHCANYYIDFQRIPKFFRSLAKDYAKFQVAEGKSVKTLIRCAYCLSGFFVFWAARYPDASTLHPLSLPDIEAFILHLKAEAATRRLKDMTQHIRHHLLFLEGLLCYLERSQHLARPSEPTTRIIWPSHYPRWDKHPSGKVKYIPQSVLTQLDTHLHHLSAASIPIVILLRASGWRISDVLYLKMDTCLEQESEKFWLVGDIQKTRVLEHKIPITKEVAAVVLAQIEWVKQTYTPEENPKKWLFPASKRSKYSQRFQRGDPREATGFQIVLNDFAKKYHIQDESGEIFHFRLHAFRHTKGVELVNNGMSLVMVQQWMAHVSPEMTLIYARILDETMRTQWEKAVRHGLVQFNEGKPEYVSGKKMLAVINEPVTFDPERVRDYRANTKLPVGNCVKPPKLLCKFTELPCFHCSAYVLTPEDLPALQTYEQQLLERIQIGVQANNSYWIEINQKNLEERVKPAITMLKQGKTVAKGEKYEREYTPKEWEQRQQHNQEEAHE